MSSNTPAALVAEKLAIRFFQEGNFTAASELRGRHLDELAPATAQSDTDLEPLFSESGFAGLAVQAVGYEEGGSEERVHVYVSKGARRAIQQVPSSEGDVAIEVNKIGKLMIRPEQANSAGNRGHVFVRRDRIACGSSCAPSGESYSGTFGALVRKGTGKDLYILSNNHVLAACNHTPVGMPILSPSNKDGGPTIEAPGEIGRHAEICELRSGEPTLVPPCQEDLALAKALPDKVSSWQGDQQAGYDTPRKVRAPQSGVAVKKFGRTTGLTNGVLESRIAVMHPLPYKSKFFTATVWFRDVWVVRGVEGMAFALPGDSGSLVVTEDGQAAIGIVFASCANDYALLIPMNHAVTRFGGIQLVDKHGV